MAQLTTPNLRGIRITPQNKPNIHYYLLVIDQPTSSNFNSQGISFASLNSKDTEILINYSGTLVELDPSKPSTTFLVGISNDQNLEQPSSKGDNLSAKITDSVGNTVKGNPNKGKPPVVELVDTTHAYIPSVIVFQSDSNNANYFVAGIANTIYVDGGGNEINGGYSNFMTMGANGKTIGGILTSLSSKGAVAAFGAVISSLNQYDTMNVTGGSIVSSDVTFDYKTLHKV